MVVAVASTSNNGDAGGQWRCLELQSLPMEMVKERAPSAVTTQMTRSSHAGDNADRGVVREHRGM